LPTASFDGRFLLVDFLARFLLDSPKLIASKILVARFKYRLYNTNITAHEFFGGGVFLKS